MEQPFWFSNLCSTDDVADGDILPAAQCISRTVYIGLDFGTTYTKVAYRVGGDNDDRKYSVSFIGDNGKQTFYKPSILIFDSSDNTLLFEGGVENRNCSKVRFFKITMLVDCLKKNRSLNSDSVPYIATNKERLCSVFFLAWIIHYSKKKICEEQKLNISDIDWCINLGVPLVRNDAMGESRREICREVLNVAFALEREGMLENRMSLTELDVFYTRHHELRDNRRLNVVPELYAEVLMYQQDNNVPNGFYAVVDIGGGTSDVAVFYKKYDNNHQSHVTCVAQAVAPFGFESTARHIATGVEKYKIDSAKDFLIKRRGVIYLSRRYGINPQQQPKMVNPALCFMTEAASSNIVPDKLMESRNKFNTLYSKIINEAKTNYRNTILNLARQGIGITCFIMGGAGSVSLYRQCVKWVNSVIMPQLRLRARIKDIAEHLADQDLLLMETDQRLLISQMLAQPIRQIPRLNNWIRPPVAINDDDVPSLNDNKVPSLQDIQDELYGI